MQVWKVSFDCFVNYAEVDVDKCHQNDEGKYVDSPEKLRVTPATGPDVMVECEVMEGLGCTFEYHRRRYIWDPENGEWEKVRNR